MATTKKLKKSKRTGYYVICVENSSPAIYHFKTKKEMNAFVKNFNEQAGDTGLSDGYWIDLVFEGHIFEIDVALAEML